MSDTEKPDAGDTEKPVAVEDGSAPDAAPTEEEAPAVEDIPDEEDDVADEPVLTSVTESPETSVETGEAPTEVLLGQDALASPIEVVAAAPEEEMVVSDAPAAPIEVEAAAPIEVVAAAPIEVVAAAPVEETVALDAPAASDPPPAVEETTNESPPAYWPTVDDTEVGQIPTSLQAGGRVNNLRCSLL